MLKAGHGSDGKWLGIILAAFLGVLARIAIGAADAKHQHARNGVASALRADVLKGVECDFFLYLRPFQLDLVMIENDPKTQSPLMFARYTEPVMDFERLIAEAMIPIHPVLALGRRGVNIGAARIETSDQLWFDEFTRLAKAAVGILMIPGMSEGCISELKWLKAEGWLEKVVFFQPSAREHRKLIKGFWTALSPSLAKHGFRVPEYQKEGSIFTLADDGSALVHGVPSPNDTYAFQTAIKKALPSNRRREFPPLAPCLNTTSSNSTSVATLPQD
jgi:hypothetical protein